MNDAITKETTLTVGLDLGDRSIQVCVLDETGEIVEQSRLPNKRAAAERGSLATRMCRTYARQGRRERE